jgi:hypothetical protein
MRALIYGLWVAVIAIVATPAAYGNCYVLENRTDYTIKVEFKYNGPVDVGTITAVELVPNGRYPVRNQWCWNTRADQWAAVRIATNVPYRPSWDGQLILGNGGPAYPSGRYILNPPQRDSDRPPRK